MFLYRNITVIDSKLQTLLFYEDRGFLPFWGSLEVKLFYVGLQCGLGFMLDTTGALMKFINRLVTGRACNNMLCIM